MNVNVVNFPSIFFNCVMDW